MDALEFATDNLEEVRARLADNAVQVNPLTDEEVITKFFSDQGHEFTNMDTEAILALANDEAKGVE